MDASVQPTLYYLNDLKDDPVPGHYYREQLRLAKDPKNIAYEIEEVLKTRKRKSKKESLIKWLFYPSKFNTWENSKAIVDGADSKKKKKRRRRRR